MLHIIKDAIPKEEREEWIRLIRDLDYDSYEYKKEYWQGGGISNQFMNMPPHVLDRIQEMSNLHVKEISDVYHTKLQEQGEGWFVRIHRYGEGDLLPNHWDNMHNKTLKQIAVSAVFYWNEDYDGGELVFPNLGIQYSPKAGDLVCFPPNELWSHQVNPIIKGWRFTTPFFYNEDERVLAKRLGLEHLLNSEGVLDLSSMDKKEEVRTEIGL